MPTGRGEEKVGEVEGRIEESPRGPESCMRAERTEKERKRDRIGASALRV
jgi:hypothetical protein